MPHTLLVVARHPGNKDRENESTTEVGTLYELDSWKPGIWHAKWPLRDEGSCDDFPNRQHAIFLAKLN